MSEEEFSIMRVAGLISPDERILLKEVSARAVEEFGPNIVLVNIGNHTGGSGYCMRAGAMEATLYGLDLNGWEYIQGDLEILNMTLIQGDSRKTWKGFTGPVHSIFVDGGHGYNIVKSDALNWVFPHVVVGGYALFHDAFYEEENSFYRSHRGVEKAVVELLVGNPSWEEQELVDTTRWFKRLS